MVTINNLVVLRLWENHVGVEVINFPTAQKKSPTLRVDLDKREWFIDDKATERTEYFIGSGREFIPDWKAEGVVGGVYDKTRTAHMSNMASDAYRLRDKSGRTAMDAD